MTLVVFKLVVSKNDVTKVRVQTTEKKVWSSKETDSNILVKL